MEHRRARRRIFAIREYMDSHYVATLFGGE